MERTLEYKSAWHTLTEHLTMTRAPLKTNAFFPKTLTVNSKDRNSTNYIRKIFNEELDLLHVKGEFGKGLLESILKGIVEISDDVVAQTPFGELIGQTLIGSENKMNTYCAVARKLNQHFFERCSLNVNELLSASVQKLSNYEYQVNQVELNEYKYAGYTIKKLEPNKGGLHVHIGNEFLQLLPECAELAKKVVNRHQISFFYVIQSPDKGGGLSLYDLNWEESPEELIKEKGFYSHQEREKFFSDRRKITVNPKEGDLIIFNGGNIWHKVEDILGEKNRITLGGFLGKSNVKNEILFWN